jgi:hypothetical protein
MVSGIAILSVFISSLGAFLIKTAATPKTLTDEVKETIKKKSTTSKTSHRKKSKNYSK